jgi:hypothetical protein
MKKLLAPLSLALALALAACQQETPPNQPPMPKTDGASSGSLPDRSQAGIDTLNQAKEVAGAVQKQATDQEQSINRQSQ